MKMQNVLYLSNLSKDHLHTLPLIVLYLTDGCNSRCAMCDIWRVPRQNMDMELVHHIVKSARRLRTQMVLLSGGEATQHPHWPSIAAQFRAHNIKVWLLTNGLLLKKQAEAIIEHVDRITVSLDAATPELYQRIRGVDALDLVLEGMRVISKAGVHVTTRTTVMRANFRQMPFIIDVALANGAQSVSFLAVDSDNPYAFGPRFEEQSTLPIASENDFGPLKEAELAEFQALLERLFISHAEHFANGQIEESPTKLRRLYDYFASLYGKASFTPPRCNAPHISVVIGVDGTLQPCYFLPPISESKNLDDLNQPEMIALRSAYRRKQRPECSRCVCPLYRGPRALLQGF
ncbi:MAG: hypothetical protein CUN55_13950 [Phototrophicales bacterium]|nr:MAG: hypothetical protein CUN55_13950 [Phototrophicales bacterium]